MNNKTLIILAAAAAGIYFLSRNRKRGLVMVESPEVITSRDFDARETTVVDQPQGPTTLERITSTIQTIFPRRTDEQRQQKRAVRTERKTARQQRRQQRKVSGFDDVLY